MNTQCNHCTLLSPHHHHWRPPRNAAKTSHPLQPLAFFPPPLPGGKPKNRPPAEPAPCIRCARRLISHPTQHHQHWNPPNLLARPRRPPRNPPARIVPVHHAHPFSSLTPPVDCSATSTSSRTPPPRNPCRLPLFSLPAEPAPSTRAGCIPPAPCRPRCARRLISHPTQHHQHWNPPRNVVSSSHPPPNPGAHLHNDMTSLCNECTMQALHSAITPPTPPTARPPCLLLPAAEPAPTPPSSRTPPPPPNAAKRPNPIPLSYPPGKPKTHLLLLLFLLPAPPAAPCPRCARPPAAEHQPPRAGQGRAQPPPPYRG